MILMRKFERAVLVSMSYEEYYNLMNANRKHGFLDDVKELEGKNVR